MRPGRSEYLTAGLRGGAPMYNPGMSWTSDVLTPPPPPPLAYALPFPVEPPPPPPPATGKLVAIICWFLIALLAGFLLFLTTRAEHRAKTAAETAAETPSMQFEISGRMAVAEAAGTGAPSGSTGNLPTQTVTAADQAATTPVEKLAMVPVVYESQGKAAAVARLDRVELVTSGIPNLTADAELLRKLYTDGPDSIGASGRWQLENRLGWFGKLAATQGAAPGPLRAELLKQARDTRIGSIAVGVVMILGGVAGLVAMIVAIVLLATGVIRAAFVRPSPGGPPRMLVLFTLWFYGFFVLSFVLAKWGPHLPVLGHELIYAAWTGAVVLLPMMRGTDWATWRQTVGLHTGRGVLLEMLCGIGGYVAGLPLLAVSILVMLGLSKLGHVSPTHPITEEFAGVMTVPKFLGLFLVVSVLAPLIEETVFRGLLYGHLRRRWHPLICAVVVALIFAMIHPQGWAAIPVLGTIAFVLAMLREWRGSLVASMTAHGLNNGAVLLIVVTIMR
jgi:membrane protease YdiL (CAAX protease family)